MSTAGSQAKPTIVLIHGLWLTPKSWEQQPLENGR